MQKEIKNLIEKEDLMRIDYCKEYGGHCSRSESRETKFSFEEIKKWGKRIFTISGSPGSGKDTVVEECIKKDSKLEYFVPLTTRNPRPGEEGVRYHFVSPEKFEEQRVKGEFLFWQDHGKDTEGNPKFYGILDSDLKKYLTESDKDIVITVGGMCCAMEMKRTFPFSTTIFISPTSLETLEKQIRGRATESEKEIEARLKEGRTMMVHGDLYDFGVTNVYGQLDKAVEEVLQIVQQRRK